MRLQTASCRISASRSAAFVPSPAIGLVQRFYVLERGAIVLEGDGGNTAHREALVRQLAV